MTKSFIIHPDGTKFYGTKTSTKFIIGTTPDMEGGVFQVDLQSCVTTIMVAAACAEYTETDLKVLKQAAEVAEAVVDAIKSVEAGHYSTLTIGLVKVILYDNLDVPVAY